MKTICTWLWNFSEWSGITLWKFGPWVFGKMIGAEPIRMDDDRR